MTCPVRIFSEASLMLPEPRAGRRASKILLFMRIRVRAVQPDELLRFGSLSCEEGLDQQRIGLHRPAAGISSGFSSAYSFPFQVSVHLPAASTFSHQSTLG